MERPKTRGMFEHPRNAQRVYQSARETTVTLKESQCGKKVASRMEIERQGEKQPPHREEATTKEAEQKTTMREGSGGCSKENRWGILQDFKKIWKFEFSKIPVR